MTAIQKIILVSVVVVFLATSFLLIEREDQKNLKTFTDERLTTLYVRDIPLLVETVDTPSTRQLGLSGKLFLSEEEGMFFVFDTDNEYGFWMKDMLFNIDIVWIDSNFNIVDIKEGATPESFPAVFKPKGASRYVLEVNEGFVERHGIKIGDSIRFDMLP